MLPLGVTLRPPTWLSVGIITRRYSAKGSHAGFFSGINGLYPHTNSELRSE